MYQYEKNHIEINNSSYDFEFDIRTVIQYKETYVVLLAIPFNITKINNIYCLDAQAKLVWQSEDLSVRYPELKNLLPYEQIGIKDDNGYLIVNQNMETSVKGIFACGNTVHVHDLVDFVTAESLVAGKSASLYVQSKIPKEERLRLVDLLKEL